MPDEQIQKMINTSIDKAMLFSTGKYGDTPTDALQLVPKKFVDGQISSVYSSIQAGLSTAGNLYVGGQASVVGGMFVGGLTEVVNLTVRGTASVAGSLKVGNNASIAGFLNVHLGAEIDNGLTVDGVPVPKTYYGALSSAGVAGTPFPSGWTSSFLGTGTYKVTHGIGSTSYVPMAIATTFVAIISAKATNDFTIATLNTAGSLQNDASYFIVEQGNN